MQSTLIAATILSAAILVQGKQDPQVPPGYFAFETAARRHGGPPQVRQPPYLSTELPCTGALKDNFFNTPRDTLCGDLNRGFVPKNPMGQDLDSQPYPFELIKNKTLHFLAKSLPFLKEDIDSIPKVVKITKGDPEPTRGDQHGAHGQSPLTQVHVQQGPHINNGNFNGRAHQRKMAASGGSGYYDYEHLIRKRSLSGIVTPDAHGAPEGRGLFGAHNGSLARNKACEQKDGIMCQLAQSFNSGTLLSTLNQAAQVLSSAQSTANTVQAIGTIASLLSGNDPTSKSSVMSHILTGISALSSASGSSATAGGNTEKAPPGEMTPATGTSNFTPLLAVLDFLASNEKSPVSQLLPARRKKPFDLDDMASEVAAAMAVNKVPPTPCPSIEEYIAPVFARNYQGVWKYVVQIPHEGYFTQTVQKTSCVKTKCDFMDGSCHESTRWVSLLVAEIFYPDARFPNPIPAASTLSLDYAPAKFHSVLPNHNDYMHSVNMKTMHNVNPLWRADDQQPEARRDVSSDGRQFRRQRNQVVRDNHGYGPSKMMAESRDMGHNSLDGPQQETKHEECDGHDKVGCYVIRVYYDWFLVPGSCKCWKKTSQGSLDAIKKIFTGK